MVLLYSHCVAGALFILTRLFVCENHHHKLVMFYKEVPYSQWYLFNANPDTNHNANTTNPNGNQSCRKGL